MPGSCWLATTREARAAPVLGVAAEDHDRSHGEECGSQEDEDAGLDALEYPVPANRLVRDEAVVSASIHARKELLRPLEDERPARRWQVGGVDGHALDVEVRPAARLAAECIVARNNHEPRDNTRPSGKRRGVHKAECPGESRHVV